MEPGDASMHLQDTEGALVQSLTALPAALASPPLLAARPLSAFPPPCPATAARADLALCRAMLTAPPRLRWRQARPSTTVGQHRGPISARDIAARPVQWQELV